MNGSARTPLKSSKAGEDAKPQATLERMETWSAAEMRDLRADRVRLRFSALLPDRLITRRERRNTTMHERLYRSLFRIRRVEEEVARAYPTDRIKSPVHLSIGQEAVSVGICAALRPDDAAFGSYRGHALYLAKGGSLKAMIAELFGRTDGCARGKGGSMHLIDPDAGVMGTSAVVGTTIPNAAGYAYALRHRGSDAV